MGFDVVMLSERGGIEICMHTVPNAWAGVIDGSF